jgi:hypothetical protein
VAREVRVLIHRSLLSLLRGGPDYKQTASTTDLYLGSHSLTSICWDLYQRDAARVIVFRIPHEYQHDALAAHMVRLPPELVAEAAERGREIDPFLVPRPHPFRLQLERVVLLVLCLPSREEKEAARRKVLGLDEVSSTASASSSSSPSARAPLHFTLHNLDSLIYTLHAYDTWHHGESSPSFFDWEKQRWIPTRRWKGCTGEKARKVHGQEKQQALQQEGKGRLPGVQTEREKKRAQKRKERGDAKMHAKLEAKQAKHAAAASETAEAEDATMTTDGSTAAVAQV